MKSTLFKRFTMILAVIALAAVCAACGGTENAPAGKASNPTVAAPKDGTPAADVTTPAAVTTEAPTEDPTSAPNTTPNGVPDVDPNADPEVTPAVESNLTPTAEPTPDDIDPAVTPTAEPTAEPTSAPTAAPLTASIVDASELPALTEAENASYGDITRFLGRRASDLMGTFGNTCAYVYWGDDLVFGTTGGMSFHSGINFFFFDSAQTLDTSCAVPIINIANTNGVGVDIGNGLNTAMTYAEIESIMGDALITSYEDLDGDGYLAFGKFGGLQYAFYWNEAPFLSDRAPFDTYVSKDGIIWISRYNDAPSLLQNWLDENAAQLKANKSQYREDLRASFTDIPVRKGGLLATITVDGHDTLEIYDSAVYGRPLKADCTGIDNAIECYDYSVFILTITDGKAYGTRSFSYPEVTGTIGREENVDIFNELLWSNFDASDYSTHVAEICEIPASEEHPCIARAGIWRSSNYDEAVCSFAYYLTDSTVPVISRRYIALLGNDGGSYGDCILGPDGRELTLEGDGSSFSSMKLLANGTANVSDWTERTATWETRELAPGMYIVYCGMTSVDSGYSNGYYLVIGDCFATILHESGC